MILTYAADLLWKNSSEEEKNFLRACKRFTDLTFHYGAQIVTVW